MSKKWLAVIVFFLFTSFMLPQLSYAALSIEDNGGFFTKKEEQTLQKEFSSSTFDYFIQTIEHLNGQSIEQVAETIYEKKRSEGIDAVLLLSMEEGEIYLNVGAGSTIERAIKQFGGADPFVQIIDNTFIDDAIAGNFGKGVQQLLSTIEELHAEGNNVTYPQTNEENRQTVSFGNVLIGLLFLIFIVVAVWSIFIMLQKRRIHQQINEILEQQTKLLSSVYEPYNKANDREGLSKGETNAVFKQLASQFLNLLTKVQQREADIKRLSIPYSKFGQFTKQLRPIIEETKQDEELLTQLTTQLSTYLQQELETSKQLAFLKEQLTQNNEKLEKMRKKFNIPLTQLANRHFAAKEQLAKLIDLEESFDFLQANRNSDQVKLLIEKLIEDTDKLQLITNKEAELADKIIQTENEVRQFVKNEHLKLVDEDPYAYIKDARSNLVPLQHAIKEGDVDNCKKLFDYILSSINQAKESVMKLVSYRDDTKYQLSQLSTNIKSYYKLEDKFAHELLRLKQTYVEAHWQQLQEKFIKLTDLVTFIDRHIYEVKNDLLEEVQQYKRAYQTINSMLEAFAEIERLYEACFQCFSRLEKRKASLSEQVRRNMTQIDGMKNKVLNERLPVEEREFQQIQRDLTTARQLLEEVPTDLEKINELVDRCQDSVSQLNHHLEQLFVQKQTAIRQMKDLQSSYQAAENRYGFQLFTSSYRRRFQACEQQINQYINNGSYDAVKNELVIGMRIIEEMKAEHARRMHEQQRRAMAEAARLSKRNSSFGGASHWGGGGSRGGGSGWKGSSGGGSSFGSRGSSGGKGKWK